MLNFVYYVTKTSKNYLLTSSLVARPHLPVQFD